MLMNINLTISRLNVNNQIKFLVKFSGNTAAKLIYVTLKVFVWVYRPVIIQTQHPHPNQIILYGYPHMHILCTGT